MERVLLKVQSTNTSWQKDRTQSARTPKNETDFYDASSTRKATKRAIRSDGDIRFSRLRK